MEQAWEIISSNWEIAAAILSWLAVSLLNFLTQHPEYVEGARSKRWLSIAVSLFAFLKSKGNPGLFKLPLLPEKNGKGPGGPKTPTGLGTVLLLVVVVLGGCGTTVLQKFNATGKGIDRAWTRVAPPWIAQCKTEALACRKEGVKLELKDCPRAQKCITGLEMFKRGLDTADRAIIAGTPLAAKEDPKAADYLVTALTAYEQATKAMQAWRAKP